MALIDILKDPTQRQLRQFGGLFLPGFLVGCTIVARRAGVAWPLPGALLGAASLSIAAALARPSSLRRVFVALQVVAFPIGWVLGHALMAIVYFGVFFPVGLLLRLFRGDPLTRRIERDAPTHWVPRKPPSGIERYFRPY